MLLYARMPQTGKPEGQGQAQLCSEFEASLSSTKPNLRRPNLSQIKTVMPQRTFQAIQSVLLPPYMLKCFVVL